jgi:hypothetical protein
MIVRPHPDGIALITQPDHACLAGAVMERCVELRSRPRRDAVLLAVSEHDAGWAEVDAAPVLDPAGEIADFIHAPVELRQGVWPRSVARLASQPWAAALVAHHAVNAYDRFRGDSAWEGFFAGMEAARERHLAASGLSFDELVADYHFVRVGDLVSLAFCTAHPERLRHGDHDVRLVGDRVVVTPDLFGGEVVPFAIAARLLPKRRFGSAAELRAAVAAAPTAILHGSVAGVAG